MADLKLNTVLGLVLSSILLQSSVTDARAQVAANDPSANVLSEPANPEVTRRKGGELVFEEEKPIEKPDTSSPVLPPPAIKLPNAAPIGAAIPNVQKPLTAAERAKQIAPFFDVNKNYVRLTQCYGTADFLGALTNVRANQTNANPQIKAIARSIMGLKMQMQPMVLATVQIKPEAKFRADYDKYARIVQKKVFAQADFNAALRPHLQTLDACSKDVNKWRGAGAK